nr:hypothetical protein Iba_chr03dCG2670 [Ipomoea batatas]
MGDHVNKLITPFDNSVLGSIVPLSCKIKYTINYFKHFYNSADVSIFTLSSPANESRDSLLYS